MKWDGHLGTEMGPSICIDNLDEVQNPSVASRYMHMCSVSSKLGHLIQLCRLEAFPRMISNPVDSDIGTSSSS